MKKLLLLLLTSSLFGAVLTPNELVIGVEGGGVSKLASYAGKKAVLDKIVASTGDDAGLVIADSQMSIGNKVTGYELVVGQGESYPVEIAIQYNGSTYTDVTTILQTDSGSSIGLFGGTGAGNILYVGADNKYYGLKAKIVTAGNVEPSSIIAEYWDGSAWVETKYMSTDADYPFSQFANVLGAGGDAGSEHWRFDFDPYILTPFWQKSTIEGTEAYWGRLRVVTAITEDMVVEQIKCHTSRWECNSLGNTEYFGASRYSRTLISGLANIIPNTLSSPSNESVSYGTNLTIGYTTNKFANTARDGFSFNQQLFNGIDTSIKLKVNISFYVKGVNTGDVVLQADMYSLKDDFVYDASATPANHSTTVTIASDSNLVRQTATMYLDISELTPDNAIVLEIFRDGGVGADTLGTSIIVTHVNLIGYFWR